eukprot:2502553-Pyramimonas_sp.AAC.1
MSSPRPHLDRQCLAIQRPHLGRRHLRRQRHGGRRGGCDRGRRVTHPCATSGRFALLRGISIGSVLGQSWVNIG